MRPGDGPSGRRQTTGAVGRAHQQNGLAGTQSAASQPRAVAEFLHQPLEGWRPTLSALTCEPREDSVRRYDDCESAPRFALAAMVTGFDSGVEAIRYPWSRAAVHDRDGVFMHILLCAHEANGAAWASHAKAARLLGGLRADGPGPRLCRPQPTGWGRRQPRHTPHQLRGHVEGAERCRPGMLARGWTGPRRRERVRPFP